MPAGQRRNSDPTKSAVERFMETFPAVIAEDRWALEKQQQMFNYPDEGYFEVFLRPGRCATPGAPDPDPARAGRENAGAA